jgi:hypothetical protein
MNRGRWMSSKEDPVNFPNFMRPALDRLMLSPDLAPSKIFRVKHAIAQHRKLFHMSPNVQKFAG